MSIFTLLLNILSDFCYLGTFFSNRSYDFFSREGTFFLVTDHFRAESPHILSELRSHPQSLFLYLKTVIEVHLSGTLDFSNLKKADDIDVADGRRVKDQSKGLTAYLERISDFPKFMRNNPVHVNDDMIELYFEVSPSTVILKAIDWV